MDDFSRDEDAKSASKLEVRRSYARHRIPHAVFRPEGEESALPGEARSSGEGPSARLGLKVPLAVLVFYILVVVGATYPRVTMVRDALPGNGLDPLCHLWVMNWYKSCLAEGKSHVYCPDLQYPTGAPLSNFPSMLFQSLLYIPLSSILKNDVLSYNIVWFLGFVFSGFSVFVLAWTLLRNRLGATYAGLAGMLCTPMMLHGHGHLEFVYAGSMSLFLAAWVCWVDRPKWPGLLASVGLYAMTASCAAYFAVFAVVPAVAYVGWRLAGAGRSGAWPWLRQRAWWFAAFLGLAVPALMLIFSDQIWAVSRGIRMHRSLAEYAAYGSPIWGYVLPTRLHPMFAVFPVNVYDPVGYPEVECAAYLGVVTMLLIGYSAFHRVTFSRSRFWWLAFGGLAVLSMGAYWRVGSHKIPMPGLWLREYVPIFQSIRVPARFNLLVCGIAAVLAGSGLVRLLARFRTPRARGAVFGSAIILLVADMNMVPFSADTIRPTMPACYAWIRACNPRAALLEVPVIHSGAGLPLTTTCGYWQSSHRMRTSAGYSSFPNGAFDDLLVDDSPISGISLLNPESLAKPDSLAIGIVPNMSLSDYAWMITTRNRFDYILLHRWDDMINERLPAFTRLAALLRGALVFEDANTLVYDGEKLAPLRARLALRGRLEGLAGTSWSADACRREDRPDRPVHPRIRPLHGPLHRCPLISPSAPGGPPHGRRHARPVGDRSRAGADLHDPFARTPRRDAHAYPRIRCRGATASRVGPSLVGRPEVQPPSLQARTPGGEPVIAASTLIVLAELATNVVILSDGFEVMLLPGRVAGWASRKSGPRITTSSPGPSQCGRHPGQFVIRDSSVEWPPHQQLSY